MQRILTVLAISALLISPALSQSVCAPSKQVEDVLSRGFGQDPLWAGMRKDGSPVVLYGNVETGTWVLVAIGPELTCTVFGGKEFELIIQGEPA